MANFVTEEDLRIAKECLEIVKEISETLDAVSFITSHDVKMAGEYQEIVTELAD